MILLDITTSYNFRHWRAMGLLRVEQEVIRAVREAFGDTAVFGIYHPGLGRYYRVAPEEIDTRLGELEAAMEAFEQRPPIFVDFCRFLLIMLFHFCWSTSEVG